MNRFRMAAGAIALVFTAVLSSANTALGSFRGSDMWNNIMPGAAGGLVNRYPLSHYQLDYYVDGGLTGMGDIPATIAQFFASQLFFIGVLAMRCVVAVYDWSNGIDLITGPRGGLDSSSNIVQDNYTKIVAPFMITALLIFGIWIAFKSIKREQAEIGSAIGRVLVMSVIAIAIVWHPQDTIGRAYSISEDIGEAIVIVGGGSPSDLIWETFVYRPHAILQHGGSRVCTGDKQDSDGFPLAATSSNPARTCHSVFKKGSDNHGDYERRFLRYAPGTSRRKAEYDAVREGQKPDMPAGDLQFTGIEIDKTDAPAVDMMQAGGALQRLVFAVLILAGMSGGILLIGLIVLAKLFAQIAILLLFMASSFMVLAAASPSLHGVFMAWAKLLGKMLVSAIVFSLLLAVTLNTSRGLTALGDASSGGYFIAFGLQSLLFLGVFFKRKEILKMATSTNTAKRYSESEHKSVSFAAGATTAALGAVSGGVGEVAGTMRQGWKMSHGSSQGSSKPDSTSPPAAAGREYSSAPGDQTQPSQQPNTASVATIGDTSSPSTPVPSSAGGGAFDRQPSTQENQKREPNMPKPFTDDLNRARSERYDREYAAERGTPVKPTPNGHIDHMEDPIDRPVGIANASTFASDLEKARREQELAKRE